MVKDRSRDLPSVRMQGEWIRAARLGSDFPTQVAFAAALGLKQAHLSKLERGALRPSRQVLERIARLTGRRARARAGGGGGGGPRPGPPPPPVPARLARPPGPRPVDGPAVLELDGLRLAAPALQAAGAVAGLVVRVPGADAILLRHVRAAFDEIAATLPPGVSLPDIELEPNPVTGVYSLHPAELARSMEPGRLPDAILREAFPSPGSAILDVGCGGGHNAAALRRLGYDVTAVDAVPEMLREAERLFPELHGRLDEGWLPALPRLRPNGFDGVLCADVLHELDPKLQYAAILNLAGLLAPGGRLLCTVPTEPFNGGGPEQPPFHPLPPEVLRHVAEHWVQLQPLDKWTLDSAPGRPSGQLFKAA